MMMMMVMAMVMAIVIWRLLKTGSKSFSQSKMKKKKKPILMANIIYFAIYEMKNKKKKYPVIILPAEKNQFQNKTNFRPVLQCGKNQKKSITYLKKKKMRKTRKKRRAISLRFFSKWISKKKLWQKHTKRLINY